MTQLKRWVGDDGAPTELRELMQGLEVPKQLLASRKAAIAARLGDVYSAATPAASAGWSLKASLGVGAGVGGVLLASALLWNANVAPAPPAVRAPVPPVLQSTAPVSPPAVVEAPLDAPEQKAPPVAPPVRATRADTLAREEALLEDARRVSGREPARALALLQRHRAEFPKGELTPERLYLTFDVLRRLGDDTGARRHADILIQRYPRSVYARRLKTRLAD